MLVSDREFALVEKCAKKQTASYSPSEWKQILKESINNLFIVTKMTGHYFLYFSQLRGHFE